MFFFLNLQNTVAQVRVSGMVVDQETKTGLPFVSIVNRRTLTGSLSNENGRYFIEAMPGDTLDFSMLSYSTRQLIAPGMSTSQDIYLQKRLFELQGVNIKGKNYKKDSLALRDEYGRYFNYKKPGAMDVLKTLPANPITALSYLVPSKARKRKEQFHEQLLYWEKEKFIDYRYSPELVQKMTQLQSPELDSFMYKYRPGYQFLNNASEYDLMLYIKESFNEYKKKKATRQE
ncbi:carboxypeptidase-like regulatory domain-containing protein [Chitinophaga nivalis]|uniref:Carboxypeptidase-like regulatory domain-containing protein n=1 Tax=Chitinophaga nivalis TaxID=2991709 RepID=A0ABT3IU62_9BACT|nr:carboxypeptidase-like regulatory domain-containing protein [Chitinophaga nivalis]MCW3462814.1 carboxypeptidase-like regulatory domain-containing protein [Chitinophaga nivalis]MCW3487496.1 carboxypeptidase-like regulatory domain-containing protein [Chitinophaga nivalis]